MSLEKSYYKISKEELDNFLANLKKKSIEAEVYHFTGKTKKVHGDYLDSQERLEPDSEGAYTFNYYLMDRDEYGRTLLANSSVFAEDIMEEDEKIAVLIQEPSQY